MDDGAPGGDLQDATLLMICGVFWVLTLVGAIAWGGAMWVMAGLFTLLTATVGGSMWRDNRGRSGGDATVVLLRDPHRVASDDSLEDSVPTPEVARCVPGEVLSPTAHAG